MWSITLMPWSHLLDACTPQFTPYPCRTLVLAPTSTESFMILGEGNAGLGSIAYIWAEGPVWASWWPVLVVGGKFALSGPQGP